MFIHQECQLELGADSVGARTENRMRHPCEIHLKQAAESTDPAEYPAGHRSCNMRFHQLHSLVSGGHIDACRFIGVGITILHLSLPPASLR